MRRLWLTAVLLVLAACAQQPQMPAITAQPPAAPAIRTDLDHRYLGPNGAIVWPKDDGFAAPPTAIVLAPGTLVDRFGSESGTFFSPKGAPYVARALPYVCASLTYHAYQIDKPLLAWVGTAAPWFDQPGGATQLHTDASAGQLLADHVIDPVPNPGPAPCP
jgi:hypothetical protein